MKTAILLVATLVLFGTAAAAPLAEVHYDQSVSGVDPSVDGDHSADATVNDDGTYELLVDGASPV